VRKTPSTDALCARGPARFDIPFLSIVVAGLSLSACGAARDPYPTTPSWQSPPGYYATGLAVADIDGDGAADLVFANGNDMNSLPLTVYLGGADGSLPAQPNWSSTATDYYTGLSAADVDHDGSIDVAVVTTQRRDTSHSGGSVQVFYNTGAGLEPVPRFQVALGADFVSFGCAFGDVDADGDLDLAVAVMHLAATRADDVRVFENDQGTFSGEPMWRSDALSFPSAVQFADMDQDGFLDLVVAATPNAVYAGAPAQGGVGLRVPAVWRSARFEPEVVAGLTVGRLGRERRPGLVISHGDTCVPSCHPNELFRAYVPSLGSAPVWTSRARGLAGGLDLIHLADGREPTSQLALVAGQWGETQPSEGGPLRIYRPTEQAFERDPLYVSNTTSVVETVVAAALREGGLAETEQTFQVRAEAAVITLASDRIEGVVRVERNGVSLPTSAYANAAPSAWLSFSERLLPGDVIRVRYRYAVAPDLAASVWTPSSGSYVFRRIDRQHKKMGE
jgi:hypothetical protein